MAIATASPFFSPLSLPHSKKPHFYSHNSSSSYQPPISSLTLSLSLSKKAHFQTQNSLRIKHKNVKALASSEDAAAITAESAQEIVSATTGDGGVSNVISVLLFIAFVGLSILTIGVIYIGVTDFLQKREKEKFEREEAVKKKKKKGGMKKGWMQKGGIRAKGGPRGFGQKIIEKDDYNDDD